MFDDGQTLTNFFAADEIAVVNIAAFSNRNIEFKLASRSRHSEPLSKELRVFQCDFFAFCEEVTEKTLKTKEMLIAES